MMILADCSFYQYKFKDSTLREITGWIDFERMRIQTPAVIIRAGQNLWRDVTFSVSWTNAKVAGMMRGSYWFYDSRADPKKQAQLWVSILGDDLGELPMFADFEDNYGGSFGKWQDWYTFLEEVKRLVPDKQIMIYTAYYYWRKNTIEKGINVTQLNYFKQYPLWVAHYNVTSPLIPQPWSEWEFWQITDKGDGKLYGVQSANIDLNYFDGTHDEFMNKYGGEWNSPDDETEEPMNEYEVTVTWDSGASVRHNPNTGGTPITVFPKGTKFIASEIVPDSVYPTNNLRRWARIKGGTYDGKYLAVEYDTPRCSYVLIGTPPPSGELPVLTVSVSVSGDGYKTKTVAVDLEPE